MQGFALFDTALGACAIAWGPAGLIGTSLPEGTLEATRIRMHRRFPEAVETPPPEQLASVRDAIIRLLQGEAIDFAGVTLDLAQVPKFNREVYAIARAIPAGRTLTYGDIAAALGDPALARAIGQALGQNPFPIIVPCHRVVAANGKTGGFSANGGVRTKLRLLMIENARIGTEPTLFDVPAPDQAARTARLR